MNIDIESVLKKRRVNGILAISAAVLLFLGTVVMLVSLGLISPAVATIGAILYFLGVVTAVVGMILTILSMRDLKLFFVRTGPELTIIVGSIVLILTFVFGFFAAIILLVGGILAVSRTNSYDISIYEPYIHTNQVYDFSSGEDEPASGDFDGNRV